MQIVVLLIKEVVQSLRDFKSMALMIIMPTGLTIILGLALNDTNKALINFSNVKVLYNDYLCTEEEKEIVRGYIRALEELKIDCLYSENKYEEDDNLIYLEFIGFNKINIKYNGKLEEQGEYIYEVIKGINFNNKLRVSLDNREVQGDINDTNYVMLSPITGDIDSISLDYYGVTMIVITIMFSSVTGAYKIIKERESGTLNKILTLPVSKRKIIWGKVLGSIVVVLIQIILTLFISRNILKVNWGSNITSIVNILLCQGVFAVSIGIFIGTLVKDNKSAWMILLTIIMSLGIFGGSFIPIGDMKSEVLDILGNFNLIKYENIALLNIIYENNFSLGISLSIIYLLLSLILIIATSFIMGDVK